ncbi:MAG: polyprenol monophosphomannose synthase [Propionibacteriaceae bacterium]|jgi:dolichol-phosphate mannosyltransferase|nr:polyprenol monophosphomannose synthase [Propionibacteriaceae bacterium]
MPSFQRVLVIIPTFNELENIEIVCGRLRQAVPSADVLIVDDNSPDGTGRLADQLAETDSQIHVLHRQAKKGLGAAYLAGFNWGLKRGYEALVEMDADGSHQPEQLPRLLEALDGADMVKGSRYVPGGSVVNWPKSRELLSRGGSWWIRLMMGMPLADVTGGFNAFRAETLLAIVDDITSVGYNFQVDLTWQVKSRGLTVVEVPITFVERERGQSKMSTAIVIEALLKTTAWGLRYRVTQAVVWWKKRFGGSVGTV